MYGGLLCGVSTDVEWRGYRIYWFDVDLRPILKSGRVLQTTSDFMRRQFTSLQPCILVLEFPRERIFQSQEYEDCLIKYQGLRQIYVRLIVIWRRLSAPTEMIFWANLANTFIRAH